MRPVHIAVGCAVLLLVFCLVQVPAAGNSPNSDDLLFITIMPHVLNLASGGTVVTVNTNIPFHSVVHSTLTLGGLPYDWVKMDSRGQLVVKVGIDKIKQIVEPGKVTLVLRGQFTSGGWFTTQDTITVIDRG